MQQTSIIKKYGINNVNLDHCSELQIHIKHRRIDKKYKNIIDLMEKRLLKLAQNTTNQIHKLELLILLEDYQKGIIALGWSENRPLMIKIKM